MGLKILVTGGCGYIGSSLVPTLQELGHDVTSVDNLMYRQIPRFHNVKKDVNDLDAKFYRRFDLIIPLAALVGMPICKERPALAALTNHTTIKRMIGWLRDDQRIIFPCTNSGYGQGVCTERSPLKPISLYGRSKVRAEEEVIKHANHVTFRLATVFGVSPTMRVDLLVNDFAYKAHRKETIQLFESQFIRNYIHVRDVVRAFIYAIDNWELMKNDTYNLGLSDANLSKKELCELVKEVFPDFDYIEVDGVKDPDQRNYTVINDKIESKGFKPEVSVLQGLDELKEYYGNC